MKIGKFKLAILTVLLVLATALPVYAENGPEKDVGYIRLYTADFGYDAYLYDSYTGTPVSEVKGVVYEKKTNTLTLTNYDNKTHCITINGMGDDFKIKLVGENHIQYLGVWGANWGGCIEFTGDGELYVNENKVVKIAIRLIPEGAKSVLKTTNASVYSYASADGYSVFVEGTKDKNCVIGNASHALSSENVVSDVYIPVITKFGDTSNCNIYKKAGSSAMYTVRERPFFGSTLYTIYQLIKADEDSYYLCYIRSIEDSLDATGLVKTEETVWAQETDYSNAVSVWKDDGGNKYIFDQEWDSENSKWVYKKYSPKEYVKATDLEGNEIQWYIIEKTDDETAYADGVNAPVAAGYTKDVQVLSNFYNLYVKDSFSLTGEKTHVHEYDSGKVTKAASCTSTGIKTFTCSCGETKTETIAKTAHSYKATTTKATLKKDGSIVEKCSACGDVKSTTKISYPKTIKLSATEFVYDGKVKKPTVTVKGADGKKIDAKNYTVTYTKDRKNVGTYSVKIAFKGNYSGNKTLNFDIVPKSTSISKLTAGSKKITVKWKKQATQTDGYIIQYDTNSNFKTAKSVTVSKSGTTSNAIAKLNGNKKYFVRICTYKKSGKNNICSAWSDVKNVKTKK